MVDLQDWFAAPKRSFFATLLQVRGEAQRNHAIGIAGEPTHWLFNIAGFDEARRDFDTLAHMSQQHMNPCAGNEFEAKLMGLPVKIDLSDRNPLPRFEICTKPWPGGTN